MKGIDLTSKKFGYLLVLSLEGGKGRKWKCQCDCGKILSKPASQLRFGKKYQSCGCKAKKFYEDAYNLCGQRFGKLTIITRIGSHLRTKSVLYLCKCDCGKNIEVPSKYLQRKDGKTNCGCSRIGSRSLYPGQALKNKIVDSYKRSAKKRKLEFSLSKEQLDNLFFGNCYYCNCIPSNTKSHPKHNGSFTYNGIDRVDNLEGYTIDNVVSCCKTCNYNKSNDKFEDFIYWIKKVYENLSNKRILVIDPKKVK